jgi:polysaccharide biosynthesis protein PslH
VPYAPTRIRTRPFHLIPALAKLGHDVTVATLWSGEDERQAVQALSSRGARAVVTRRLPRARPLWNCARALLTREPLQAHFSWSPSLARELAAAVESRRFDVVHVEHLRAARYALALLNRSRTVRTPVVWDSVDCISTLFRQAAHQGPALRVRLAARVELRRTERYEGNVAPQFDRVLVTSQADGADLLALADPAGRRALAPRLEIIPCGVDLERFSPTDEPREPMTIVMTGKMSYHANVAAAVRFVEDVMPLVWKRLPAARLLLVGQNPPREVLRLTDGRADRVVVTGAVPDTRPYLRRATLAVAPLQYCVGMQNKILEALACATPVVATPQAVSALAVRSGEELMVAADPGSLADAVVQLIECETLRTRIGRAGLAYVQRNHDWAAIADRLSDVYRSAIS